MSPAAFTATDDPQIYVASLSDYNAGRLFGVFVHDLSSTDAIWEEVNAMLARSNELVAEEWAIHDYQGFGDIRLSEYESFDRIVALAAAIEEHGLGPVSCYVSNDSTADLDDLAESYQGHHTSEKAYAQQLVDDCGGLQWFAPGPDVYRDEDRDAMKALWEAVENHIDWDSVATDLFSGDLWSCDAGAPDYGVHVFRSV